MLLASYNIQFGRGRDGRTDLARIAGELAGADIIALQEVERGWSRSGHADQPARLAELLGEYYWVYGPGVDLHGGAPRARGEGAWSRRQFGNQLLSRWPIAYARHHLLPQVASNGPLSLQRSALECVIHTPLGVLRFYSVHLTSACAVTRLPQVECLIGLHRNAQYVGAPVQGALRAGWTDDGMPPAPPQQAVLLGDFNFQPDAEEYARLVGPLSDYGGRSGNPALFVDAWVAAGHAETAGATATLHGRPVRFDYCFVSTSLAASVRTARIDGAAVGSDHQPIWTELAA